MNNQQLIFQIISSFIILICQNCRGDFDVTEIDELQTDCTKSLTHFEELVDLNPAVRVNVSLTLLNIEFDNGNRLKPEVTALINQEWEDDRVQNDPATLKSAIEGNIWQPYLTLVNGRILNNYQNEKTEYWRLLPNGRIFHSSKMVFSVRCGHNLKYYPFDFQECLLKFGSYRFSADEVLFEWPKPPVEIETLLQFNEFELVNISTYTEMDVRHSRLFSVVVVNLNLQRRFERILLTKFLPAAILLFLAYLSFWFSFDELKIIRYGVSISAVVFEILFYTILSDSVESPILTALDVWYFGCLSLSVYTILHSIMGHLIGYYSMLPSAPPLDQKSFDQTIPVLVLNKSALASWLDNIMRILFPTLCFCLLVLYCALYVSSKH